MSILDKLLTSVHRVTKEIELIPAVELLLVRGRVQHEQVTTLQPIENNRSYSKFPHSLWPVRGSQRSSKEP